MRPNSDLPTLGLARPGPERDRGPAAILAGERTALTGLLELLQHAGEPVPSAGHTPTIDDDAPVVAQRFHLVPGAGVEAS